MNGFLLAMGGGPGHGWPGWPEIGDWLLFIAMLVLVLGLFNALAGM